MITSVHQTLERPFANVDGFAFSAKLDAERFPLSDGTDDPMRSCLMISEDGADLGPAHTAHQLIAAEGRGAFSHWNGELRFSSSDGSDPNANGRRYEARWDREIYFATRAKHALAIVENWARHLPSALQSFQGQQVLEIGPGRDMGTIMILRALGARTVWGIDRFKGAWEAGWHDPFLHALKAVLSGVSGADLSCVERAIDAQSMEGDGVEFRSESFEQSGERLRGAADITVSHSVFEHFYSMPEAAASLAAATRMGGRGVHHVDFRDHRNFGTPLEFLLVDDAIYAQPATNDEYGRGNRVRMHEMQAMLADAGFRETTFVQEQVADAAYLDSVAARLAASPSRFAGARAQDLAILSGAFLLVR